VSFSAFAGSQKMIFKPLAVVLSEVTAAVFLNQFIFRHFKLIEELVFDHQPFFYLLLLVLAELTQKIFPELTLIMVAKRH
jgi:hypothetical protein